MTNKCNLGQVDESGEHEPLHLAEIVTQLSEPENPVEGSQKIVNTRTDGTKKYLNQE